MPKHTPQRQPAQETSYLHVVETVTETDVNDKIHADAGQAGRVHFIRMGVCLLTHISESYYYEKENKKRFISERQISSGFAYGLGAISTWGL